MATAVYVRISRDADLARLGVERQRVDCEKLCSSNGWSPVSIYEDNDVSAFSGKRRPAYLRMLDDIKAGAVDRVVAWHPDRLHRSPRELEDFIDLIEAAGCAVVTVTAGHYDLSTPAGRTTARVIGAVARGESEHKSERIRRKVEELAEAGKPHIGGSRPFGYQRVAGVDGKYSYVIDEAEAAIVREMMGRFLAGESLYSLSRDLQARGVPTVAGGTWTRSGTLQSILTRPVIAGQRAYRGKLIAGTWPAIVTPDDVANARAVLAFRQSKPKRTSPAHVLNGIVVCAGCGGPLYAGESRKGKSRLRCRGASEAGCVTINREDVVDIVTEAVLLWTDKSDLAAHAPKRPRAAAEDMRDAEAQLAELATAYADRVISMGEWKVARAKVQERLEAAQAAAGETLTAAGALIPFRGRPGALRAAWPDLSDPQRHAIFSALIDRIVIGPGLRGPRVLRDRVEIFWR
ncbi:MAG TPA: recombinase family protein [Acidimicrobiales bacterium]|nr:recombinase family protein [Acidimicrobiales bacterium]